MSAKAQKITVEVLGRPSLARRVAALTWLIETRRNQLTGVAGESAAPARRSGELRAEPGPEAA